MGEATRKTCDAMVDVMRLWLTRDANGFWADMANSLVKHNDEGKFKTIETWNYMFNQIRPEFPEVAFVAEQRVPHEAVVAGFNMDFHLDQRRDGDPSGCNILLRNIDTPLLREDDMSYFNSDADTPVRGFLDQYVPQLRSVEATGAFFSLITGSHNTLRVLPRLTTREQNLAWATTLTLPGVPSIYYGNEIGLRHQLLLTKEGGYICAGAHAPMQWDGILNLGFSMTGPGTLYLPVDSNPDTPTVALEQVDPDSLWHSLQRLTALHKDLPALRVGTGFAIRPGGDGRIFAFVRCQEDDELVVTISPGREGATLHLKSGKAHEPRFTIRGVHVTDGELRFEPQSFAILQ